MKFQAWLFFIGTSVILHILGLSLYISLQDKITPSKEGQISNLEIVSHAELSLMEKWSTRPSLNSNSQSLYPQENNDDPPVQQPNANSTVSYQKRPVQIKQPTPKDRRAPKIQTNNTLVTDLSLTIIKPISPVTMTNYDEIYTAISTSTKIYKPDTLISNTKEDFHTKIYEPKTADLPQIDISKPLLNYEPNNSTDPLTKKTLQIDRKPDPKIRNPVQTEFSSLQFPDQTPTLKSTNQSPQIQNNNSQIDDDISREWGFNIIKALKHAIDNPSGVRGEASVSMELTISKDGDLLNVKIIQSSGNLRFDRAAQKATQLANFPRAPLSFTHEKKTFKIKLIL
jgi:TonB family protein